MYNLDLNESSNSRDNTPRFNRKSIDSGYITSSLFKIDYSRAQHCKSRSFYNKNYEGSHGKAQAQKSSKFLTGRKPSTSMVITRSSNNLRPKFRQKINVNCKCCLIKVTKLFLFVQHSSPKRTESSYTWRVF